ncbi:MAG: 2-dehydro-3-deoxyphosphogluconate aldolase/(4S)-4-hydroxy-2-oxoglutarate aldolase [Psychromonas sp.]|jgi:2-dehydro-3-deoxyphosphogluconate aldolase/(4S)-4-hydroxy-2-oxoglutarate aldolase
MNWTLSPAEVFAYSPVVPVMVINHLEDALPMAKALAAGGVNVFEVTLRTKVALEAIKAIATAMPKAMIGAGTIINAQQ